MYCIYSLWVRVKWRNDMNDEMEMLLYGSSKRSKWGYILSSLMSDPKNINLANNVYVYGIVLNQVHESNSIDIYVSFTCLLCTNGTPILYLDQ